MKALFGALAVAALLGAPLAASAQDRDTTHDDRGGNTHASNAQPRGGAPANRGAMAPRNG